MNNRTPIRTVPVQYARNLLKVAEEQGYDPASLLKSIGMSNGVLTETDPNAVVDARSYNKLYTRVMWVLQDESFGLALKEGTPTGTFRMLCLCIVHCETLEAALRRAAEFINFCHTLTGQPRSTLRPTKRCSDGTAMYFVADNDELVSSDTDERSTITVAHTLAIWRRFCGWLIGKTLELKAVHLQSPKPENPQYFERLFGCPVEFGMEHNAFVFAQHFLDCPMVHTEESLRSFLRNAPYHLMVATDDEDTSLIAQMKRLIGNDLSREFPSVVMMAEHLNMSVRTLRRRLKEHGTTYQQFKDNLRKEQAIRWLNQPELKINAVSALLGFDEPSAFHRSFKKWTGMTPGEYRQQAQSEQSN